MVWIFGVLITLVLMRWNKRYISGKFSITTFVTMFLMAIARIAYDYKIGIDFYDVTYEVLIGFMILIAILSLNGKKLRISENIRKFTKLVANYSFTLYLIHVAIIGLIFAMNITYDFNYPPRIIIPFSFIVVNFVAFIIAYTTEMKHKKVSNWLKQALKHNQTDEKSKNYINYLIHTIFSNLFIFETIYKNQKDITENKGEKTYNLKIFLLL